jgi:hypothetical protein
MIAKGFSAAFERPEAGLRLVLVLLGKQRLRKAVARESGWAPIVVVDESITII